MEKNSTGAVNPHELQERVDFFERQVESLTKQRDDLLYAVKDAILAIDEGDMEKAKGLLASAVRANDSQEASLSRSSTS